MTRQLAASRHWRRTLNEAAGIAIVLARSTSA
jgi:hypothetical protein